MAGAASRTTAPRGAMVVTFLAGVAVAAATSASAQPPPPSPTPTAATGALGGRAVDDRGFVDSAARCDGDQSAVALAVTETSLVTICVDPAGGLVYRGVRLVDGAGLSLAATPSGTTFTADNAGVRYRLSDTELLVATGDTVIRRDAVTAYRAPRLAAEAPL